MSGVPATLTIPIPATEGPLRRIFAEVSFGIPSKATAVASAVEMVRRTMEMVGVKDDWVSRTELCLQEALLNAHFHGNRSDARREIHVRCTLSAAKVELYVEDERSGYDWDGNVSSVDITKSTGRGLFLIRQLMDSVTITGNHIAMSLSKESNYGN